MGKQYKTWHDSNEKPSADKIFFNAGFRLRIKRLIAVAALHRRNIITGSKRKDELII